ncbi:PREDICTED: transcription factor A, mitochondrial isoform X2 [Wasmannia auropunctata]|uniref:transcription factor A, mitochondrial isoform X2 n=1 Tax=Wasmannia auropunctata TaxID=64793 RepID=UPI0005ED8230|nr:PREDICTED: transcription factor A, mitochondrial isoform X2 [Wasmannia auropunctata]
MGKRAEANQKEFASTQDFTTSKLKHGIKKDTLPSNPKKPLNTFLLYYTSIKNKLQEEYPNSKQTVIMKKASEKWAQIDPTIKQNFQKQYLEQNSVYKQKLMDYENSLTNKQRVEVIQRLLEQGHTSKKPEIKQRLTELGKPKRPLSAFILFLQNKRITKKPQISYKDWIYDVTEEWKNMPMEDKNKYNAEAKDLLEKYKIELKKWQEDMIKADERHGSTEDMVLRDKNVLQTAMEYPRNMAMDTSINDVKKTVIPHCTHIHTQIYTYFVSTWKRVLTVLTEIRENWKMVREYIFIGTVGILISIFCVLNLMYK